MLTTLCKQATRWSCNTEVFSVVRAALIKFFCDHPSSALIGGGDFLNMLKEVNKENEKAEKLTKY